MSARLRRGRDTKRWGGSDLPRLDRLTGSRRPKAGPLPPLCWGWPSRLTARVASTHGSPTSVGSAIDARCVRCATAGGGADLSSEPQPACARRSVSSPHPKAFAQLQMGAPPKCANGHTARADEALHLGGTVCLRAFVIRVPLPRVLGTLSCGSQSRTPGRRVTFGPSNHGHCAGTGTVEGTPMLSLCTSGVRRWRQNSLICCEAIPRYHDLARASGGEAGSLWQAVLQKLTARESLLSISMIMIGPGIETWKAAPLNAHRSSAHIVDKQVSFDYADPTIRYSGNLGWSCEPGSALG